jgi:SWI/SNF-related matrix-associated actin-dependent regulator 1 of chromatin subfamily A
VQEALQWHFRQEAYEPLQAALSELEPPPEVQPVPAFARALLSGRHAQRLPAADADALLARLPTARGASLCLATDLKAHQTEGVLELLSRNGRGILADEMGLGKTAQAIALAACYPASDWPLLVMCPSSLRATWQRELAAWLPPGFAAVTVVQTNKDAAALALPASGRAAVIVSYDMVGALPAALVFGIAVADECHLLKSAGAVRTAAATPRLAAARRALCITGTPLLSRPAEVFTSLAALMQGDAPSFKRFADRYCAPKPSAFPGGGLDTSGASCVSELHILLTRTLLVRRTKEEAGAALPPKTRCTVTLPLGDAAAAARIATARSRAEAARDEAGAGTLAASEGVSAFYMETAAAKAKPAAAYLLAVLAAAPPGAKLLFFAHHAAMLDAAQAALQRAAIPHMRIDGTTPAPRRTANVDAFQAPASPLRAALLSLGAAGVGLTLTAACHVIMAELSWTPGLMLQAEDRAHRVGQTAPVRIEYLLSDGTADDWMWPTLERKLAVTGAALDGRAGAMRTGTQHTGGASGGGSGDGVRRKLAMQGAGGGGDGCIDLCSDSEEAPAPKRARPAPPPQSPFSSPAAPVARRQSGAAGDAIELD